MKTLCLLLLLLGSRAHAQALVPFASEHLGFRALLPPGASEQPPVDDGDGITIQIVGARLGAGRLQYLVGTITLPAPPPSAKRALEMRTKTLGEKVPNGKVVSDRAVMVAGLPGREIRVESRQRVMDARVVVVGRRIYQIVFTRLVGAAAPPEDEVRTFLESFALAK